MYVAPLNFDWFFKKVFSSKKIAKAFLEDVLNVVITEIKLLSTTHKLSDDAVVVKFDFRCKINGQYVIIEMQQKYKLDVNKRFYLYHCINTALQLETLKPMVITKPTGETYKEKNYNALEPVITIVWMVDDTMNFTEDIIAFSTIPEAASSFLADEQLWLLSLEDIKKERAKCLKILENTTKGLDFFSKNRILYIFQRNIVRNKTHEKYSKWFDFAEKSKNLKNSEKDFVHYKNDDIMAEVIKRLKKESFKKEDLDMAKVILEYEMKYEMYAQRTIEDALKERGATLKAEIEANLKAEMEAKIKAEVNVVREAERQQQQQFKEQLDAKMSDFKEKAKKAEKAEKERLLKAIKAFLEMGKDVATIASILDLTVEETTALVKQIPT